VAGSLWQQAEGQPTGTAQSFLFNTTVGSLLSSSSLTLPFLEARLWWQFYLFDKASNLSLSTNVSYTILPAFAKFSIGLFSWPWASAIQVRMLIHPPFSSFTTMAPVMVP